MTRHPFITPIEYDRRPRVFNVSRSDSDAARRLGLSKGAFAMWRRREGIKPHRHHTPAKRGALAPKKVQP